MSKTFTIIFSIGMVIFLLLSGVMIYFLVAISEDPPSNSQYVPEPENFEIKYHMVVSETVDAGTVNLENYVSIKTLKFNGKSFADYNEGMSEEYHYYNRYYVDNVGLQEINADLNRYLYGADSANPDFVFDVSKDYKSNEWLIRKDYELPSVGKDEVTELLLIDSEHVKDRKIESVVQRIDITKTAHVIEDEAVKKQVIDQFLSGDCMFYESVRSYTHTEKPAQYLILAKFENSVIYQCVGYQME